VGGELPKRHPLDRVGELRDRLEVRRDRRSPQPPGVVPRPFEPVLLGIGEALGADAAAALRDPELAEIERTLDGRVGDSPFPANYNATRTLARLCWVVTRLLRPKAVVETGVAAGFTSSYLAAALEANGAGELHSVDPVLGGPEVERNIGLLVPPELRGRQTLHRARSRRVLRSLLRRNEVGVFVHDGLHTEPTMRWELSAVTGALSTPAAVLMDDAELNPAFAEWAQARGARYWSLVETEAPNHFCAVAVV
jgi:hypothetical protein